MHEVRLVILIVLLILFLVVIFLLILLFFEDLSWPCLPSVLFTLQSKVDETLGRAMREQALRLLAIRQARLEPLALSASGRESMV